MTTQTTPQVEAVAYEYPDLGEVEILLQNESAEIYRFIRGEKGTGIEYFERLDQLGALRAIRKTAHHSRWEYMVLQMYLIQKLKTARAFGLSTSLKLRGGHTVSSGEELLKCWVLLNNYGHLVDTFEAERVWLELIFEEPRLRQVFLDCMPDNESKDIAVRVLKEEDLYRFHHLITLALLRRLSERKRKLNLPFDLWIEMVKAMLREPKAGSKLERSLSVFNTIRRASYVLLDMNRTSLFLRIDANNLLRNIVDNADTFLYEPEADINKTLDYIERLLFSEVYADVTACEFKYEYLKGQKNRFRAIVSKNGMDIYCKNYEMLTTRLNQAKISNFGKHGPFPRIQHMCRLNLLPVSWFERSSCLFYTEKKELHSSANANADFLITPTPYPESGSIVDVFVRGRLSAKELSSIYRTLTEYVLKCYQEWDFDGGVIGYSASNPLEELFSQILRLFIHEELTLRFAEGMSPRDYHVEVLRRGTQRCTWVREFLDDIKETTLPSERDWELRALSRLLARQGGDLFLIGISNIHLYGPKGNRKVEWDGVFFDLRPDAMVMYVVEAKRGISRRSNKAKDSLLNSLRKAGIQLNKGSFSATKCNEYACTRIALEDALKV